MIDHALFGFLAGILSACAYPVYIAAILKGRTKPSRVTWWVLAILNAVLVATYYASGARDTLWLPISYVFGFTSIGLLSLKYGESGWERTDTIALAGAAVSLLAWWTLQSAEYALYLIILTDLIGLFPTILKSFNEPWTESKLSWLIAFFASALNIVAIETWTVGVSLYPVYVVVTNAIILYFIAFPFRRKEDVLPHFPNFKKLEFSDKDIIDECTHTLPIYSDFDFASLWSWNVKDDMQISSLNGNIVLRFTDYLTGEPFYTFIGLNKPTETVRALLQFSEETGVGSKLHLIPHEVIENLDPDAFDIEESRDHFDYVLSLERYLTYSGGKLKSRRNFLNYFKKNYSDYEAKILDLSHPITRQKMTDLYRNWKEQKGFFSLSESFAYDRFLESYQNFDHVVVGLILDEKIIAFHISTLPPGDHANGLFEKADTAYQGIYQALMHEVAKALIERGKYYLNYEQDLGIESLRKAKLAFDPHHFQKKYTLVKKGHAKADILGA